MAVKENNNTFVIQNNGASSYDCIFTIDDGSHQNEGSDTKDISTNDLTYTESNVSKNMDSINTEVLTDSENQNLSKEKTSLEESNFIIEDSQIVMDHSEDGEISSNDTMIYNATNADDDISSHFVTNDCGHSSPLWSYGEFLESVAKGDSYFKGFYYTNSYEVPSDAQQENLPEENVVIEDSNIDFKNDTSNNNQDTEFTYNEFIFENMNEDITSNISYNTSSNVDNISNEEELVSPSNTQNEPEVIAPCDPNYKAPEHGDFYTESYTESNAETSDTSFEFVEDDFKDYVGEKLSTSTTSNNDDLDVLETTDATENFETKFFNDYANQFNNTTTDNIEIFEDDFSSSTDSRNYEEEFLAKFNYTNEDSSKNSTSSFTEEEFFSDTTFNSANSNTTIIEDSSEDLFFKNCESDIENTKCDCCTPPPRPVKKVRKTCCNNNNHSNDFILFIVVLFLLWYSMSNNNNNCGSNNNNNCCCNFTPYYF